MNEYPQLHKMHMLTEEYPYKMQCNHSCIHVTSSSIWHVAEIEKCKTKEKNKQKKKTNKITKRNKTKSNKIAIKIE